MTTETRTVHLMLIPSYRSLPDPDVMKIGQSHVLIHPSVIVLFAINLWLRMGSEPGIIMPLSLSAIKVDMVGLSGWQGGELEYVACDCSGGTG